MLRDSNFSFGEPIRLGYVSNNHYISLRPNETSAKDIVLHSTPHHQTQISTDISETTDYGCNDSSKQRRCDLDLSINALESPIQPKLAKFPETNGRRFSAKYFELYIWLEYSCRYDSVYCFACRHFSRNFVRQGEILGNIAFIDVGIQKWKDLNNLLKQHENSVRRKNSMTAWSNFKNISSYSSDSIASILDSTRAAAIKENREHIRLLFKVAIYLAKQGLALRGDNESDDSLNKGNYIELLESMSAENLCMQEKLQKRYGHYTSPEIQNDIINIIAECVRNKIRSNMGPYWTLLVDETRDASRKEQLSFAIRSTSSKESGKIFEKVLGTYHLKEQSAEALTDAIQSAAKDNGLEWKLCMAQCYDGASVMSGSFSGVQARIREFAPHVMYIHCLAHRLNLVLISTIKSIAEVNEFFSTVQELYVFLSTSTPRHELFCEAQREANLEVLELERLVETRWSYWYRSISKVKLRLACIINTLDALITQRLDGESAAKAKGLIGVIKADQFIKMLLIMEMLLGKINSLSEELQSSTVCLPAALKLVTSTREELLNCRNDDIWNRLLQDYNKMAETIGINLANENDDQRPRAIRISAIPKKLTQYFVQTSLVKRQLDKNDNDNLQNIEISTSLKTAVFFEAIDRFVAEIDRRFASPSFLIACSTLFDPYHENFLQGSTASTLINHYPYCGVDIIIVESQLEAAKQFLQQLSVQPTNMYEVYDALCHLPAAYSEIIKVLNLILTLPVTTATNERIFSNLKRVKTYLRTKCGNERLSDLLVICSSREEVRHLNLDELVDLFARKKTRRYPLLN